MIWKCDKCGLTLNSPVLPVFCCTPSAPMPVCIHRGQSLGKASCGCGTVYECTRLGGICSPLPPVDEWATVEIEGVKKEIRDLNYQCCRDCAEFRTTT